MLYGQNAIQNGQSFFERRFEAATDARNGATSGSQASRQMLSGVEIR
jgi:hypothetical protein